MGIIKEHIDYLKNNPEGYWFKRKLYGFGWTPAKPAGWAVIFAYLLLVVGLVIFSENNGSPALASVAIVAATALLLGICWKKGESLKWQWGIKKENPKG